MSYLTNVDLEVVTAPANFLGVDVAGPIEQTGAGFKVIDEAGHRFVSLVVMTQEGVTCVRLDDELLAIFVSQLRKAAEELVFGQHGTPMATMQ